MLVSYVNTPMGAQRPISWYQVMNVGATTPHGHPLAAGIDVAGLTIEQAIGHVCRTMRHIADPVETVRIGAFLVAGGGSHSRRNQKPRFLARTFIEDCQRGALDFGNKDLRGAVARSVTFRRCTFAGATLDDADLSASNVGRSDFRGASLRNAILRGTDFEGADLRCADLRGADLRGAVLRNVNLSGALIDGADLRGAWMEGAVARGVHLSEETIGLLGNAQGMTLHEDRAGIDEGATCAPTT